VLVFSYFGDRNMSVKIFDETRCRQNFIEIKMQKKNKNEYFNIWGRCLGYAAEEQRPKHGTN
jgi:hypothetical protein